MLAARIRFAAFIAAAALSIGSVRAAAHDAKKPDVTGKWLMDVESEAGSGTPTVTFKQTGDSSARDSAPALSPRNG